MLTEADLGEMRRLAERADKDRDGEWFNGASMSYRLGLALEDTYFIAAANPTAVIALLDALEAERTQRIRAEQERGGYLEQHHRDSETLRRYAAERDVMKAKADALFSRASVLESDLATAKGLLRDARHYKVANYGFEGLIQRIDLFLGNPPQKAEQT